MSSSPTFETAERTQPVTILDIARHLGISKTTVSSALTGNGRLNQDTREMVLQAARELNYQPHPYAQHLRKKNSGEIVLVSENIDLGVATRKMAIIQMNLVALGFNAPIHAHSHGRDVGANQDGLLASVARVQPRAVVCNAMELTDKSHEILRNLQEKGTVVVCYDAELDEDDLDQIIFDREDNTYQAAKHLLDLGHRDIGLVMFRGSSTGPLRLAGFERALREAGLEPNPDWVYQGRLPASAEVLENIGVQAAHHFAELSARPTGVCVLNDLMAMAFTGEMMRAGFRVPLDISVVGHDDIPLCRYAPLRLSSVSHPVDAIAQAVVDRVTRRLQDESLRPGKQWFRGEIQARDSSAAPQ